jgi:hypothetical protein
MMKTAPISLALAFALFGCADSSVGDDGGGNGGSGSQEEPQPERQVDAQGTYRLNSTLDIVTNMPGNAGSFINGLIEATDDPDDPMSWVVDQMLAKMDPGTLKSILVGAKPFVIGYLNDRVTQLAPDLVGTLLDVGQRMRDLMKELGLNEKLEVNSVDQTYIGRITVDGIRFKVEGTTTDVLLADHDIDDAVAGSVHIALENQTRLLIGEHTLTLPYGKVIRIGLDMAIIPAIDPNATTLAGLLDNVVDCQGVGAAIASQLGVGGTAFWAGACVAGLDAAADTIYAQILGSGSTLDFHLTGSARAVDSNSDYKLDKLASGTWTGSLTYTGTDATLPQPATFVGSRM